MDHLQKSRLRPKVRGAKGPIAMESRDPLDLLLMIFVISAEIF